MSTSDTVALAADTDAQSVIDSLSNQLCRCVDGRFDMMVTVTSPDESLQKLATLINFVLDGARRALEDIRQRELLTRSIVETAAEGIITITDKGIVESFNAAAETMFGYAPAEIVGQNISILMPSPHAEQHDQYLADYLRTGQAKVIGIKREVEGRRKDGTTFPAEIAVSEVSLHSRHIYAGIVRDLTTTKRLQCELAHAQKLESIGQLAAGIAHEINTPIQYVGDNARFLDEAFGDLTNTLGHYARLRESVRNGTADDSLLAEVDAAVRDADVEYLIQEIPTSIQQSLEGVERVATIVRAMKEFSHPGTVEKTRTDINAAIQTTITVARNEWKYVAQVVTDFDPQLPRVPCLPGDFNQLILNLIVNAAHAIDGVEGEDGPTQGTITLSTRSDGDWVEIRVSDTGTGIPEHVRDRIFDPFFTTKDVGKGTGQGLAIAHSVVVDKHHGTIDFETSARQGTTFIIRLPVTPTLHCEGA